MRANGDQLREITSLIEAGIIRPVIDRVFPFERPEEALAYVETGRAKRQGRRHDDLRRVFRRISSPPGGGHRSADDKSREEHHNYREGPGHERPTQTPRPPTASYRDAPTRSVSVRGVDFVYRQLGPDGGVPLILLNHLAAVLDNWDPRVVDGIAARRPVIAFDNRGVGGSAGATPPTIGDMAHDAVLFIRALGFDQVDLLGLSMGGFIAQIIAAEEPHRVRRVIRRSSAW